MYPLPSPAATFSFNARNVSGIGCPIAIAAPFSFAPVSAIPIVPDRRHIRQSSRERHIPESASHSRALRRFKTPPVAAVVRCPQKTDPAVSAAASTSAINFTSAVAATPHGYHSISRRHALSIPFNLPRHCLAAHPRFKLVRLRSLIRIARIGRCSINSSPCFCASSLSPLNAHDKACTIWLVEVARAKTASAASLSFPISSKMIASFGPAHPDSEERARATLPSSQIEFSFWRKLRGNLVAATHHTCTRRRRQFSSFAERSGLATNAQESREILEQLADGRFCNDTGLRRRRGSVDGWLRQNCLEVSLQNENSIWEEGKEWRGALLQSGCARAETAIIWMLWGTTRRRRRRSSPAYPLTISVLPYHAHSTEIGGRGAEAGTGVMLHLPMRAIANETPEAHQLEAGMSSETDGAGVE